MSDTEPEGVESALSSDLLYARVASHIFNTPLLVLPDVAETIGAYVRMRMEGVRPEANRFIGRRAVDPSGSWKGYQKEGNVGIVSIMGELVNRGAWIGASSGLTSYEGIVQQVRAAAADTEVETIVLDINSPGGEALGMTDAARGIRLAAGGKKIVSVINSIGASAGYGLATAGNEIVVTESGIAGSIGVVMVHFDQSERAAKAGVKATVITNTDGVDKARGHSFAPLTEEDVSFMRAKADKIMDGFVKLVIDHRPALTSEAIRGQGARTFIGEDAVAAGLADRVGSFDSVMSQLASAQPGRVNPNNRRYTMSTETTAATGVVAKTFTQAEFDAGISTSREEGRVEGHAAGLAEGVAKGRTEGATETKTRIAAILGSETAKGREKLAHHLAFNSSMSAEEVETTLAASAKESTGTSLTERMTTAPNTSLGAPAPGTDGKIADPRERGRVIAMQALGKPTK